MNTRQAERPAVALTRLMVWPISGHLLDEVNVLAVNGFLPRLCTKEKHGGSEGARSHPILLYIYC